MKLTHRRQVCTFDQITEFQIFHMHLTLQGKGQSHLPFEIANDVLQLNCVRTACREFSSALCNEISQIKNLYPVEYGRICKCHISLHFLCAAHILHCFAEYFFFSLRGCYYFSTLCFLMSPDSLPGSFCLHSHGTGFFSGCGVSHLNWTQFWYVSSLLCLSFPSSPLLTHEIN
jgi:hypothetical protein